MRNLLFILLSVLNASAFADIECVWLSHKTPTPKRIVVGWFSKDAGNGSVIVTNSSSMEKIYEASTLGNGIFHAEIPMPTASTGAIKYRVQSGNVKSEEFKLKPYPDGARELRIAMIGDIGGQKRDYSKLIVDKPHLLITLGDNVPCLWRGVSSDAAARENVAPYIVMAKNFPREFLASTPIMPILGNHDKEFRRRGKKYPKISSYDIDATAYRSFFELPDEEWKWEFSIPAFKVRFIALDLQHTMDLGTTWQTCHDCHPESEQFKWYVQTVSKKFSGYTFTLQNQHNGVMRNLYNSAWKPYFEKSNAVFTGYGYYQERAFENIPYYNSCIEGSSTLYPDKFSKFINKDSGYILMRIRKDGPVSIEIKNLKGEVMDKSEILSAK